MPQRGDSRGQAAGSSTDFALKPHNHLLKASGNSLLQEGSEDLHLGPDQLNKEEPRHVLSIPASVIYKFLQRAT